MTGNYMREGVGSIRCGWGEEESEIYLGSWLGYLGEWWYPSLRQNYKKKSKLCFAGEGR